MIGVRLEVCPSWHVTCAGLGNRAQQPTGLVNISLPFEDSKSQPWDGIKVGGNIRGQASENYART